MWIGIVITSIAIWMSLILIAFYQWHIIIALLMIYGTILWVQDIRKQRRRR